MYNGKIEVSGSGRKITIWCYIWYECQEMRKTKHVFCCFFYFMLFGRINGNTFRQLVKFGW